MTRFNFKTYWRYVAVNVHTVLSVHTFKLQIWLICIFNSDYSLNISNDYCYRSTAIETITKTFQTLELGQIDYPFMHKRCCEEPKYLLHFFAKNLHEIVRIWNSFETDIGTIRKMLTLIIVNCVLNLENACLLFKDNFISFAFHKINEFCNIFHTYN